MRRFFYLILALLSLTACANREVLTRDEMTSLIYDMYVLDGYVMETPDLRAAADSMNVYLPLIEKYGCDRDKFETSLRYYLTHDADMLAISRAVLEKLRFRKSEIEIEMEEAVALAMQDTVAIEKSKKEKESRRKRKLKFNRNIGEGEQAVITSIVEGREDPDDWNGRNEKKEEPEK